MVNAKIDYRNKVAEIECPEKTKTKYTIRTAPGGFIFYEVHVNTNRVPQELAGKYTGLDVAVAAVTKYIENMPMTAAVSREVKAAKREESKNATADHAEGSQ